MKAIQISKTGGPEVLTFTDNVPAPSPTENNVLIEVLVAGVNYIDTYFREGIYPTSLPFIPGKEGVGRVVADPSGSIAEGTLVAWCGPLGSYAQYASVPKDKLVAVPEGTDLHVAASMLLQGITAHYLCYGVKDLQPGDSCLITAGAGGVGLILTQMAKAKGATVISLVSTDYKAELARQAGADEVIFYDDKFAQSVRKLNGGQGVDIVYDGVGKATFDESLACIRPRGIMCLFGAASGPVEPIDPQILNTHGSLFLTRPSLDGWTSQPDEFRMRAQAVTQLVSDGTVKIRIGAVYPLAEAEQAHRDLQARKTTGSVVLEVPREEENC
ncbi:zinc-binding dehydrogenase [Corynebacterium poyangense]|uniref:Zinc-binding dehydrogenase n=1 Tax=Corynebacterium poyangense TaxID=2684405 RepID=A0A7H0SNZ4_9CORY|nr:quinone oxidoreductase [Corynebacterium poyangense]QNQ90269.1 zinc-binding dehydrogenase [Corynebacterium poyangense]